MQFAEGRMKKKVMGAVEAIEEGVGKVIFADGRVARADHARAGRRRDAHQLSDGHDDYGRTSKNASSAARPPGAATSVFVRGEGCWLYDSAATTYLDLGVGPGRGDARSLPSARDRGDRAAGAKR